MCCVCAQRRWRCCEDRELCLILFSFLDLCIWYRVNVSGNRSLSGTKVYRHLIPEEHDHKQQCTVAIQFITIFSLSSVSANRQCNSFSRITRPDPVVSRHASTLLRFTMPRRSAGPSSLRTWTRSTRRSASWTMTLDTVQTQTEALEEFDGDNIISIWSLVRQQEDIEFHGTLLHHNFSWSWPFWSGLSIFHYHHSSYLVSTNMNIKIWLIINFHFYMYLLPVWKRNQKSNLYLIVHKLSECYRGKCQQRK